eukprot:COSAG01_NODE_38545_length_488_cov_0.976864_1_plen_36_part_10
MADAAAQVDAAAAHTRAMQQQRSEAAEAAAAQAAQA